MSADSVISSILEHNKGFAADDKAAPYRAGKKPKNHLAVVACMDTRLITMLSAALGLENGDANFIKVAGGGVDEPYGAVMRSLLVAIYELDVDTVMIVAHTECGAQHMSGEGMGALMKKAGITEEDFAAVKSDNIDLDAWLEGFGDTEAAVRKSVDTVKNHPLVADHVTVKGYVIDTQTGELTQIC